MDQEKLARIILGRTDGVTYGELVDQVKRASPGQIPGDFVDKTLQKLRRRGLIAHSREGRNILWRPTELGRDALTDPA